MWSHIAIEQHACATNIALSRATTFLSSLPTSRAIWPIPKCSYQGGLECELTSQRRSQNLMASISLKHIFIIFELIATSMNTMYVRVKEESRKA